MVLRLGPLLTMVLATMLTKVNSTVLRLGPLLTRVLAKMFQLFLVF